MQDTLWILDYTANAKYSDTTNADDEEEPTVLALCQEMLQGQRFPRWSHMICVQKWISFHQVKSTWRVRWYQAKELMRITTERYNRSA